MGTNIRQAYQKSLHRLGRMHPKGVRGRLPHIRAGMERSFGQLRDHYVALGAHVREVPLRQTVTFEGLLGDIWKDCDETVPVVSWSSTLASDNIDPITQDLIRHGYRTLAAVQFTLGTQFGEARFTYEESNGVQIPFIPIELVLLAGLMTATDPKNLLGLAPTTQMSSIEEVLSLLKEDKKPLALSPEKLIDVSDTEFDLDQVNPVVEMHSYIFMLHDLFHWLTAAQSTTASIRSKCLYIAQLLQTKLAEMEGLKNYPMSAGFYRIFDGAFGAVVDMDFRFSASFGLGTEMTPAQEWSYVARAMEMSAISLGVERGSGRVFRDYIRMMCHDHPEAHLIHAAFRYSQFF